MLHAALMACTLEMEFRARSQCDVTFAAFDLVSRRVGLPLDTAGEATARLYAPPRDREARVDLMTVVVSSARLRDLLDAR